jgi:hypothetical protein
VQWEPPSAATNTSVGGTRDVPSASAGADAPADAHGWEVGWTEQGVRYFFHVERQITQWDEPAEWRVAVEQQQQQQQQAPPVAPDPPYSSAVATMGNGGDGTGTGAQDVGSTEPQARDGATAAGGAVEEATPAAGAGGDGGARDDGGTVDANTGLGSWTVVEEESIPADGWAYNHRGDKLAASGWGSSAPPAEKRQRVAWATNRAEEEEEEEEDRLEDIKARFAVPDEMHAALAREEAAAAKAEAAEEAAAVGAAVFAKRKGNRAAMRKK